ncbi:MAG: hypothetical protein KC457_11785, partial [Myxococcales bacterium]|nr:hypothetical protein [Myxococcales bacterium]
MSASGQLRVLVLPLTLVLATALGCKDESNLAKTEQSEVGQSEVGQSEVGQSEVGQQAGNGDEEWPAIPEDPSKPTTPTTIGSQQDTNEGQSGGPPPEPALEGPAKLLSAGAGDRRVELRLGLVDGARYRITTLGMVHLPLIDRPTGFAREEELSLGKCDGEGSKRSCLLSHSYRNYEAEPPAGEGLERDEKQVAALATSHRIDASGLRTTETAVVGPAEAAESPAGKALVGVDRFFCIRLPAEPVGEGATWQDVCRQRQGGVIVTRDLTWQLAKIEDTKEGTRAELQYAGSVAKQDNKGEWIRGQVKGALYFWVDAGEPHMMRERMQFVLNAGKSLSSGTDLRVQFTKVADDGETLIRTD